MKVKVISLPNIFQILYVFSFTWTRYQVSVYRTIGPLVYKTKWLLFRGWQIGGTPETVTRAKLIPNFFCVQNQDSAE